MPTRTASPVSVGLIAELTQLTGCRPGRGSQYGAALMSYGEDGAPRQVGLLGRTKDAGCDRVIRTLASLTLARPDQVVRKQPREILIFPLQGDTASCLDAFDPKVPVEQIGDGVTTPRVIHEAKPNYTPGTMQRQVQGRVVADVIVSERGCPAYASVKRGLDPELDLQALQAILQWKFEPALAGGAPVPVWVTIEVAFRLK